MLFMRGECYLAQLTPRNALHRRNGMRSCTGFAAGVFRIGTYAGAPPSPEPDPLRRPRLGATRSQGRCVTGSRIKPGIRRETSSRLMPRVAIHSGLESIQVENDLELGELMKMLKRTLLLQVFLLSSFGLLCAQQGTPASQAPADNTKVNERDRNQAEPTADQQKENSSDRQLTQKIRRAVVEDKSLSTTAHNVKIISQNGSVTLKGPVKSEEEKQTIETKATQIAGQGNVKNEIEVAPK